MKKNKTPGIVILAILTLITSVFWLIFGLFRVFTVRPSSSVEEELLAPIDPTLDAKALDSLEERNFLEDSEIPDIVYQTAVVEETPLPQETPEPEQTPPPEETENEGAT